MHRERGKGRVEALVGERQVFGHGINGRGETVRALGTHSRRRLHRGDLEVAGLVGAGPGTYVDQRSGATKGLNNCVEERWLWLAVSGVVDSRRFVVEVPCRRGTPRGAHAEAG